MAAPRLPAWMMLALLACAGCGKSWHRPEKIAASPSIGGIDLAIGGGGHAVAVWDERAAPDDIDTMIWAVSRDRDGSWAAAEPIGTGHQPRAAVDPAGSAVAVWEQGLFEAGRVWASRYTPGRGWSAAQLLSDQPADGVDVAMDAAGQALAVFDQDQSISARRHDGLGWRAPEVVGTAPGGLTGPKVAMNAAGDAFVSWTYLQPDGADDSYYLFRVSHADPNGAWSGAEGLGGTQTADSSVAVDRDGNACAFWSEQNNGAWFACFAGGAWQGGRQLAPIAASLVAAADGSGDAVVVWDAGDDQLRALRIADGEPGETVILAGAGTASDPITNRGEYGVAAGSGDAIAIWHTEDRLEASLADVSGWDPPELLDEGTIGSPRIAMNDSGEAIAVWLRAAAAGGAVEIWATAFR